MRTGVFADELAESMTELKDMLEITNREWPEDFSMQDFIDYRDSQHERDNLPTTEELEEERSGRASSDDELEDGEAEAVEDNAANGSEMKSDKQLDADAEAMAEASGASETNASSSDGE